LSVVVHDCNSSYSEEWGKRTLILSNTHTSTEGKKKSMA
jgi:hypothetical protein